VAALPAGLENAHDIRGYPPALCVKQGWVAVHGCAVIPPVRYRQTVPQAGSP
jgi:hypothetical protein